MAGRAKKKSAAAEDGLDARSSGGLIADEGAEDVVRGAGNGRVSGELKELIRVSCERMEMRPIDSVIPYARNARAHDAGQIAKLRGSLRASGFVKPLVIDEQGNLLAGHGILEAARLEGMPEVPCNVVTGLSEVEKQAYIIADNALGELSAWAPKMLDLEVKRLSGLGFDTRLLGLKTEKLSMVEVDSYTRAAPGEGDWFADRQRNEGKQEGNDEYNAFIDKFEPKRTTDDCYTPDLVYDAVAEWVADEYGLNRAHFVRPFFPGADYKAREYGPEDVVVDNPPFSIISEIVRTYKERDVRYFLFAPALTLFSRAALECGCCIAAYADITYENGAVVCTSFVTNLEPEDVKARTAPKLTEAVETANEANLRESKTDLPKYVFPDEVLTAATMGRWSSLGIDYVLRAKDCVRVSGLDAMKEAGKGSGIFGGALLLSEKAAAEKVAAEKPDAERWQLSERELALVAALGYTDEGGEEHAGTEAANRGA